MSVPNRTSGRSQSVGSLRRKISQLPSGAPVYVRLMDADGNARLLEVTKQPSKAQILPGRLREEALILDVFDPGAIDPKNDARPLADIQSRLAVMWMDVSTRQRELLISYANRNSNKVHRRMVWDTFEINDPEKWNLFAGHVDDKFPGESLFDHSKEFYRMDFIYYTQLRIFLMRKMIIDGDKVHHEDQMHV